MRYGILKKLIPALLVLQCIAAAAQGDSMGILKSFRSKPSFQVLAAAGFSKGQSDQAFLWQIVPGLQYKTWFAGIGAGLDQYYLRGVPLFVDVRKYISPRLPLFLYADAGLHFPWIKKTESSIWYTEDYKKGFYYDTGLGWSFNVNKQNKMIFSAGFSGKKVNKVIIHNNSWAPPGTPPPTSSIKYDFRTISVKAGFVF